MIQALRALLDSTTATVDAIRQSQREFWANSSWTRSPVVDAVIDVREHLAARIAVK
jgi:hypothetical protein